MAARGSSKLNLKPDSEVSKSIVAGQKVFIEKRLAHEDSRHLSYILPGTVSRAPFGCFYVTLDDHPRYQNFVPRIYASIHSRREYRS